MNAPVMNTACRRAEEAIDLSEPVLLFSLGRRGLCDCR
jgi:hypothetical protein